MAVYRNISLSFWTDSKIDETFSPEDKYFFLYLLTNPHTNLCGCYEISKKQMSTEMGYTVESVTNLLKRFVDVHRVIAYDDVTKEILIYNWSKYNWTSSERFRKAVNRDIAEIKNDSFREFVYNLANDVDNSVQNVDNIPYRYRICNSGYPIDTTVSVTVSDTDTVTDAGTGIRKLTQEEAEKMLETAHKGWANRKRQ